MATMKRFSINPGQSSHNNFARQITNHVANVVLAANTAQYIDIPADIGVSSQKPGIAIFGTTAAPYYVKKNGVSGSRDIAIPAATSGAGEHPIVNPTALCIDKDVSSLGFIAPAATIISIEFTIA